MAEEPNNLVLKMLREIRQILDENTDLHKQHQRRFDILEKKIDDRQETTATGSGLAMHANIRTQALEAEIADLKRRIERLEKTH